MSLRLVKWLQEIGEDVECCSLPLNIDFIKEGQFDLVISYSYCHLISEQIISAMNANVVNLHISYLPWNRGVCPNQWSFIENTPKGVTIHYANEGLDKGDIIAQKLVPLCAEKTLAETYQILNEEMIKLFQEIYPYYPFWQEMRKMQKGRGTYHSWADSYFYEKIPNDYLIKVCDIIPIYRNIQSKKEVYIFTEGNSSIGLGHIMRCMALYQACIQWGTVPLLIINGDESILRFLENTSYILANWYDNPTIHIPQTAGTKHFAVIDSYQADITCYEKIQKGCDNVIYIDDMNRLKYPFGIILNPAIFPINYSDNDSCITLSGKENVILRKEFLQPFEREISESVKEILICMGGSDILDCIPTVLEAVFKSGFKNVIINVIITECCHNQGEIRKKALILNQENKHSIIIHCNIDAYKMRNLMENCDMAISAAGQTIHELLAMQLPFIPIKCAYNQENNIRGLKKESIITSELDYTMLINPQQRIQGLVLEIHQFMQYEVRKRQYEILQKIIIGNGARHAVEVLMRELV